jgi:hypothetical protein
MRRKISFMLMAGVAVAAPCFAGLFDDGYFWQLIAQGVTVIKNTGTLVSLEQEAQQNISRAAAFVRNPSGWSGAITRSQGVLDDHSNGNDQVALSRLNLALKASREVYGHIDMEQPTTQNMATLSILLNNQASLKNEADKLSEELETRGRYLDKMKLDGDWGCVSCTLGAHQQ